MISYLQGTIQHRQGQCIVLLVQGVGYEIELPARVMSSVASDVQLQLWVHQIVREDANDLYGFISYEDRQAFRLVLKAPKVGPKLALAILDVFSAAGLAQVGFLGSANELLQVKGLGKKLADKLIVDLKSWAVKGLLGIEHTHSAKISPSTAYSEALQALVQLGYKESQVRKALHEQGDNLSAQELIRQALKMLSNRGV